jgi:outer membrane protein TolC
MAQRADSSSLDALVGRALQANPAIIASARRVEAARARIGPAGALPDPMLSLGIQNLPLGDEAATAGEIPDPRPDMMTMKMVGLGQTIPFPGKLRLARAAARHEVESAEAMLAAERLRVAAEVRAAYYRLAAIDHALDILERNRSVLVGVIDLANARYATGKANQQDVLRARVEGTRLAESATVLREQRVSVLAQLNSLLSRPGDMNVAGATVPARIARAAVDTTARVRFVSDVIGARLAASPLPPVRQLQDLAEANNSELLMHRAQIDAQRERTALVRKAHLPDFDVMLEYGQRSQRPDMISARVSIPIPVFRKQKQEPQVHESEALLSALESEHHSEVNQLRARVAQLHSDAERARTQLVLLRRSILPEARATLEAATAAFRVGSVDMLTLLDTQSTLFSYETEYFRLVSDFATAVAELERTVGKEVLP